MTSLLRQTLQRVRSYFPNPRLDEELDAEMAAHLEFATEENLKKGMPTEEARRQALVRFGGVEQAKQRHREARGGLVLGSLIHDFGYALRMWWKNPGFALAALITIGLGIGVNATVFTLAHAVLSKDLGFEGKGNIVYVIGSEVGCDFPCDTARSYPDYLDFRAHAKTFDTLAAYRFKFVNVSDKIGFPDRYKVAQMSANGFGALKQKPILGRDFIAADEAPGAEPVAILTYGAWEIRYGKDPSIIGKTIRVNEVPTVVVGIMPAGVQFSPIEVDMWVPLTPTGDWQKRDYRGLMMFGRLAPWAKLESANAEMNGISRQLENEYPLANKGIGVRVLDAKHYFLTRVRLIFVALWIAVGFVLLIACANVANLLLSRAVGRAREISIRIALGAKRWRVIRQLLVESVTLSLAGGFLGWLLTIWGVRAFDAAIRDKPIWLEFSMDYTVLIYLAAISIASGILFGLAPALRLSKVGVHTALKDGGPGTSAGTRGRYLTSLLIVTEMALTVVLLVGASVMIRLIISTYRAQIGVNSTDVLTMSLDLPEKKYPRPNDQMHFYEQLLRRLQAVPGMEMASIVSSLPGHDPFSFAFELEGSPSINSHQPPHIGGLIVGSDYFRVMDVTPLLGRVFADSDEASEVPVVIVNHLFAARFWPRGVNPLGKRLRLITNGTPQRWRTVVGVVPDIFQNMMVRNERDPLVYLPDRQQPLPSMFVVARTKVQPTTLARSFRSEVQAIDADLPVNWLRTLDDDLDLNNWPIRVFGTIFSCFAVVALLMASVGLYAVVAHTVNQRTQEIGVRLAMGASRPNILGLVFAQGMRHMALGLCLGLAAAFGLTRVLRTLVSGVLHPDLATFLCVTSVLLAAGGMACIVPANRATRVDPMEALRYE